MANKLWLIAYGIVLFALKLQVVFGESIVPCFFIFGDSLVDNGNNNNLATIVKSNYTPYGIDFKDGATGRFTNGRTSVDILSQFLGFDEFIPSFASARGNGILKGVNYGSGASGILNESGTGRGNQVISLDNQLRNHLITVSRIKRLQANNKFTRHYLRECFYTVVMGSNDYINNYLRPDLYNSSRLYTPDKFAAILVRKYKRQLKTLHKLGARKVAIFGLGPIGCTPGEIAVFGTIGSACVDNINNMVQLFNDRLKPLVRELNHDLTGANFTLINSTSITSGDPSIIGVTVVNAPCCTLSNITGLCVPGSVPCSNRNQYSFYDAFHPTEIINQVIATRSYTALSPFDAYPIDISRLVQL